MGERNPQEVSGGPPAAIELSSATTADSQATREHDPQPVSEGALAATKVSTPHWNSTQSRRPRGRVIACRLAFLSAGRAKSLRPPRLTSSVFRTGGHYQRAGRSPTVGVFPPAGFPLQSFFLREAFPGAIDFAAELRLADDTLVDRRLVRRVSIDPGDEKTNSLLRVAEGLLAAGDMAAARLLLRRAAEAGNARAALLFSEIDRVKIDPGVAGEKTIALLRVAESLLAARNIFAARLALRRATQAGNARACCLARHTTDV
jgi:hypothetical protein